MDPRCRLSVRNRVTKRTRVVWNSRCPKWNEEFRFLVHFPGASPPAPPVDKQRCKAGLRQADVHLFHSKAVAHESQGQ